MGRIHSSIRFVLVPPSVRQRCAFDHHAVAQVVVPRFARCFTTLLALALACTANTSAQITFSDFRSTTGLHLVGTATQNDSVIDLNSMQPKVVGGIWYFQKQTIADGFTTRFKFQIRDTSGQ